MTKLRLVSHAVMSYLANRYATPENASLYPADPVKRAYVDQAMYFEATSLYLTLRSVIYPIVLGDGQYTEESLKLVEEKLALLNEDLGRHDYVAGGGNDLTIADLTVLATYTSIAEAGFWDNACSKLTNVHAWIERIRASNRIKNYDELVVACAKGFGDCIKAKVAEIQKKKK